MLAALLKADYFTAKIDPFLTQDATVVTYSYDALGRLAQVGTPSDADFYASYTYHADGKLNAEILANGAETRNHFYNPPGWLLRIDGDRFTEDITQTTGWGGAAGYYDGRIKTTSFTYNWAGKPADYAVQYTYDNLGQLTIADNNINNAWDIGIGNSISYDANGNILDLTRGSTTKTYAYYAGTNKVQNLDGSGNDYVYDSNANVTSSSPKNINTIVYDSFTQRPTSVNMSLGASLALEYGGDTQRVLKNYTSGGSTNSRLYLHGANDYPLIEKNKTSATVETLAVYIYGLNGAIAKRVGSTVLFLLKDHLGSTRVVMDAAGLVRTYYDYDALGNIIRIGTTNEVKYQFTGQEIDESSLHNYRARLYDSDLGKFYAMDPAGQFSAPYSYAGNNPISLIDPSGKFSFIPILFSAAYAAGNAIIDKKHVGLAAAQSAGLNLVSQGIFSVAHPAIGNHILAQGVSGGITSGIGSSLNNGSFGRGFVRGAVQSMALAAITGDPYTRSYNNRLYREEPKTFEKISNFVRGRGWREDFYGEDFAEKDYTNFLTRLSTAMGYDVSQLAGGKVIYDPSVNGGRTNPYLLLMRMGDAKGDIGLETIGNAQSLLTHEWAHVEIYKMLPPPFGPNSPFYLHEVAATWIQMTSPYALFTTPAFRENMFDYFNKWAFPIKYGMESLGAPGTPLYNKYIYGNTKGW